MALVCAPTSENHPHTSCAVQYIGVGTGGAMVPQIKKNEFWPHSFGEVREIVFSDSCGWKMQTEMHAKLLLLR